MAVCGGGFLFSSVLPCVYCSTLDLNVCGVGDHERCFLFHPLNLSRSYLSRFPLFSFLLPHISVPCTLHMHMHANNTTRDTVGPRHLSIPHRLGHHNRGHSGSVFGEGGILLDEIEIDSV